MTTATRERPIILHAPEIRALLAGQLTQVRRPVMPQPDGHFKSFGDMPTCECHPYGFHDGVRHWACPFGAPGTVLWVKEAYRALDDPGADDSDVRRRHWDGEETHHIVVDYKATPPSRIMDQLGRSEWKSPATMPRWACRLTIELTAARVEHVQAITEADAVASGLIPVVGPLRTPMWESPPCGGQFADPRVAFQGGWDTRHAAKGLGWDVDPWVWCGTFRRVEDKS